MSIEKMSDKIRTSLKRKDSVKVILRRFAEDQVPREIGSKRSSLSGSEMTIRQSRRQSSSNDSMNSATHEELNVSNHPMLNSPPPPQFSQPRKSSSASAGSHGACYVSHSRFSATEHSDCDFSPIRMPAARQQSRQASFDSITEDSTETRAYRHIESMKHAGRSHFDQSHIILPPRSPTKHLSQPSSPNFPNAPLSTALSALESQSPPSSRPPALNPHSRQASTDSTRSSSSSQPGLLATQPSQSHSNLTVLSITKKNEENYSYIINKQFDSEGNPVLTQGQEGHDAYVTFHVYFLQNYPLVKILWIRRKI